MAKALVVLGHLVGGFLILRAAAEVFVIDLGDPSSYAQDWGGPSLAGVLLVHCLPGVIAAVLIVGCWLGRRATSGPADG